MHIRSDKMLLATHWKLYDKDKILQEAVPSAIKKVAVSLDSSFILINLLHGWQPNFCICNTLLQEKFVMDTTDEVAKSVCTNMIQNSIRQQRYRLKKFYWPKIKKLTTKQAYLLKPHNVEENSWKELVNIWFDKHYQVHNSYFFHPTATEFIDIFFYGSLH